GGEGRVEVGEQRRLLLGDRRDDRGRPAERLREPRQARAVVGEVGHRRREVGQQRGQRLDRPVEVLPTPGEGGAEAVELLLGGVARLLVEGRQELVELDRRGRGRLERDRRALVEALRGRALGHLDVLQAQRRLLPDQDRG